MRQDLVNEVVSGAAPISLDINGMVFPIRNRFRLSY